MMTTIACVWVIAGFAAGVHASYSARRFLARKYAHSLIPFTMSEPLNWHYWIMGAIMGPVGFPVTFLIFGKAAWK